MHRTGARSIVVRGRLVSQRCLCSQRTAVPIGRETSSGPRLGTLPSPKRMLSGRSVGFTRKPVVNGCPQVEPHQSQDAADDEWERTPILATQSQQLNERAVRPQAALEEADFLLQRGAAQFIAEEAAVDGTLEYSHSVSGHSGVYRENRRA